MEELELVPERNFWDRSYIVPVLPKELNTLYLKVKNKYGPDIANLIILAYKEWHDETIAISLAKKILSFSTFEELMDFLYSKARLFGEGKSLVNDILYNYQYSYYFSKVLDLVSKEKCDIGDMATSIFHKLAKYGLFYSPRCIIEVAKVLTGCSKGVPKACIKVYEAYRKIGSRK